MSNIKVIVEIPMGSSIKYEYDRFSNQLVVDRILRNGDKYPTNYGFIPQTIDWDGDELDVLIFSKHTFMPGSIINVKIVGAMKMIDEGETDTKLIGIHADDYALKNINKLQDLPENFLDEIQDFFLTYKKHKGDVIKITGFMGSEYAFNELKECTSLYNKYKNLPKKEFVSLMRKKHPNKYC